MSQHATQLCTLLVHEVYGELSSRVFDILLRRGRSSLNQLLEPARLPERQLKNGLAVLIQQHLVLHYSSSYHEPTYYEANWKAAYDLVRCGKIIKFAEEALGEAAGRLTADLMLQGHAVVRDLRDAYTESRKNDLPKENGDSHEDNQNKAKRTASSEAHLAQFYNTLQALMDDGLVSQVRKEHFRSVVDDQFEAQRIITRTEEIPPGAKGKVKLAMKIRELRRDWRDGNATGNSRKRALEEEDVKPKSKRLKRDSGHATVHFDIDSEPRVEKFDSLLNDDMVVRVNYDKYTVISRNKALVELAQEKLGTTSAQVYAEVLAKLGKQIPRCQDDLAEPDEESNEWPSVNILEMRLCLERSSNVEVDPRDMSAPPSARDHEIDSAEEDLDLDLIGDDEDEAPQSGKLRADLLNQRKQRRRCMRQHLELLTQDSLKFISFRDAFLDIEELWVDFRSLVQELRQHELETILAKRFGPDARRIVRCLLINGKLDEKQIAKIVLVRPKEARECLDRMGAAGFLEIQEVPRDASRAPARTLFLWYFDAARCAQAVLEDTYQTMARMLQRGEAERAAIRSLLEKAERTDVKGNWERYLTADEYRALGKWRAKEERLLGQVGRLDRLVAILRDF